MALGAYINAGDGQAPDTPAAIDAWAERVGRTPAHVLWYQDWTQGGFPGDKAEIVASRGALPILSWDGKEPDTDKSAYPADFVELVAEGRYDAFLTAFARGARDWGAPYVLRPWWEMNAPWTFCGGVQQPASAFVAMWRHVHDLFVREGAVNTRWFWCPNVSFNVGEPGGCAHLATLFPGDAYVDYVGLDGYNWGPSDHYHSWTDLSDIFAADYEAICALSSRPFIIGETASTENGGDKATWITKAFLTDLAAQYSRLVAVTWFDQDKEQDWRINSSPAALAAFRQAALSPLYGGVLR